jgi:hypothetical protein
MTFHAKRQSASAVLDRSLETRGARFARTGLSGSAAHLAAAGCGERLAVCYPAEPVRRHLRQVDGARCRHRLQRVRHCHSMGGLREPDASPGKRCRHCGETMPREDFSPDRRHRDGLHSWCRACVAESKRRWRAENRESYNAARRIAPYPPRICATCGQEFAPMRRDQRYCRRWCREHRYLTRISKRARS